VYDYEMRWYCQCQQDCLLLLIRSPDHVLSLQPPVETMCIQSYIRYETLWPAGQGCHAARGGPCPTATAKPPHARPSDAHVRVQTVAACVAEERSGIEASGRASRSGNLAPLTANKSAQRPSPTKHQRLQSCSH
jgi:hypothetical protein